MKFNGFFKKFRVELKWNSAFKFNEYEIAIRFQQPPDIIEKKKVNFNFTQAEIENEFRFQKIYAVLKMKFKSNSSEKENEIRFQRHLNLKLKVDFSGFLNLKVKFDFNFP